MFEDPNAGGGSATSDPPVGTGGSGGAKSVPSQEEDVSGFEEPTQSDPPVGTGGSGGMSDPPTGTGDGS